MNLSRLLGLPHFELDAIFHQPGWTELPTQEFRAKVGDIVAGPGWIIDGNYSRVRNLIWERADTVVWLDMPRRMVIKRLLSRSLGRVIFRRELWNTNREQWRNLFSFDPSRSIIAWGWTRGSVYRERFDEASKDPQWSTPSLRSSQV